MPSSESSRGARDDGEDPNIETRVYDRPINARRTLASTKSGTRKTHDKLASDIHANIDNQTRQLQPRKGVRVSSAAPDSITAPCATRKQRINILQACLPLNESTSRVQNILADIFPVQNARKVWRWSVPWSAEEDLNLIIGVTLYGFGNWSAIEADPELGLTGKLFPGSKELIPNDVVLERRVDYLLTLIGGTSTLPPPPTGSPQTSKDVPGAPLIAPRPASHLHSLSQISHPPTAYPSPPQSDTAAPDIEVVSVWPSSVALGKRKVAATPASSVRKLRLNHKNMSIRPHSPAQKIPFRAKELASLRDTISHRWTRAARQARAASVVFVNDVDKEDLPPGMENFRYLESSIDESHIRLPFLNEDDKPHCRAFDYDEYGGGQHSCITGHGSRCSCIAGLSNSFRESAYDKDGFFRLDDVPDDGEYVIECNEFCCCSVQCPNRRSQWPRDVPLQIFKVGISKNHNSSSSRTDGCSVKDYGWGVRATTSIRRGQVLGFFTGELRERPANDEFMDYGFDIDYPDADVKYTVDATTCGNWARFLNHSCDPNLMVYTAAVEFPPAYQLGRIVFVALEDIPPLTELTFDYCPGNPPPFLPSCLCGSKICRDRPRMYGEENAENDPDGAYEPAEELSSDDG